MHTVTAQQQYDAGYPDNRIDMTAGNISVMPCKNMGCLSSRSYGYCLYNSRVNKAWAWYKYKSMALEALDSRKSDRYWGSK